MKTITLRYDDRDPAVREALRDVLAMGTFKIRRVWPFCSIGAWQTRRAIRDVERGKVIHAGSFEDFKRMMENV